MARDTQCKQIMDHMVLYGSINPIEALQEYGIMRLASRISDLKKRGECIESELVHYENKQGQKKHYKKYFIGGEDE